MRLNFKSPGITNVSYIKDLIEKGIEYAIKKGADFVEIRYQEAQSTNIVVRKGAVEASSLSTIRGIGVRVLVNGSWGYASLDEISWQLLERAISNAYRMARASSKLRKRKIRLAYVKPAKDRVASKVKIRPSDISVEEKMKMLLEVDKTIREYSDRIKDDNVVYADSVSRKIYMNSEGAEIEVNTCRVRCGIRVTARENDIISPAYEVIGGTKGYELIYDKDPVKLGVKVAKRAVDLLHADVPKGGLMTAVLDNSILGLIVHEAFGHTAEADLVLSGTILTNKIGKKVASDMVTIIDSPGPEGAYGWLPYDDEGVKGRDVVIVKEGILMGYMHSRETAFIMGAEPTGNARAQSYAHPPLVRMRNTYMAPGDWKPDEIIQETKEGIYLKGGIGGQSDTNGEFMFSVQEAWYIRNGELIRPLRGVTISGNAIEVLKSIDAVGNDLKIGYPGMCGKFQLVPVDGGGPHIRCKVLVGGKR
ncbi:MAG: TldD/PmbA family protein [Thermoprotei archaeon]|nr:MAG: TldD/PmbA family protein [Thermoprotei archaeon]